MSLSFLMLAAALAAGAALQRALDPAAQGANSEVGPWERLFVAGVLGVAALTAVLWGLALTGWFAKRALALALAAVTAGAGAWLALQRFRARQDCPEPAADLGGGPELLAIASVAPLAAWTGFALWRGWILPPLNHDVLAYHLTKAALIVKAGAFRFFEGPDFRVGTFASNYELLLAGILALDGCDRVTEWISTASFLLLLAGAAALAERWWGRGVHLYGMLLGVASMPIALLHSAAHKNDLLGAAMALGAITWASSWAAGGRERSSWLAVAAAAFAVGTKAHYLFLGPPLLGALAVGLQGRIRRGEAPSARMVLGLLAFAAACALLLGGAAYAFNAAATGNPLGMAGLPPELGGGYGDWYHLWMVPVMLWLAPFTSQPFGVWNPWFGQHWLWPKYEIFTSNYGWLFSALCASLPIALLRFGRRRPGDLRARERWIATAMIAAAVALILPIRETRPVGFFNGFTRYLLFAAPVAVAWTLPALLRSWTERGWRWPPAAALAALALACGQVCLEYGENDGFAPLPYVTWAMDHPGTREIPFRPLRAANILDRMAGPSDRVLIEGGFDAWSYPAFGNDLGRSVTFRSKEHAGEEVPGEVAWVAIDYSWTCIFGHPDFKHFGLTGEYLFRGRPRAEEKVTFERLTANPCFELVYRDDGINQAVFRRVARAGARCPPGVEASHGP